MEIAANQNNYRMKQSWRQASMQALNSSVARPSTLGQNTSGQASRQTSRASGCGKLEQNNMRERCPFWISKLKTQEKAGAEKLVSSVSKSSRSCWSNQLRNTRLNKFVTMKGSRKGPFFCGGPKTGPQHFFSVQRLHGLRQVVQHVQLHVAKIGLIY